MLTFASEQDYTDKRSKRYYASHYEWIGVHSFTSRNPQDSLASEQYIPIPLEGGAYILKVLYSSTSDLWKICDFATTGEGTSHSAITTEYARGVPGYRAPELLPQDPKYSNKSDIWALGCILYEMLTRRRAFSSDFQVYQWMHSSEEFDLSTLLPEYSSWRTLIRRMLQLDPTLRPRASVILLQLRKESQVTASQVTESHGFNIVEFLNSCCPDLMSKVKEKVGRVTDWDAKGVTDGDESISCHCKIGFGGSGGVYEVTSRSVIEI